MDAIHDEVRSFQKRTPRVINDIAAFEAATDDRLAASLTRRAEWVDAQALLAEQSMHTTGKLPYELAYGYDGGVANVIAQ